MLPDSPAGGNAGFDFDTDLIRRHDRAGPRYTSYPTALEFHPHFDADAYRRHAALIAAEAPARPLSLYFHLPFCATVCYYCACHKIVTRNRAHVAPYLARLEREIALHAACLPADRTVSQLHWGGGTPTFLSAAQMTQLMAATLRHFRLADDRAGEFSIEVDPRATDATTMRTLRGLGFNRVSFGVQDFDPRVQRAVNRIQSEACTLDSIERARSAGFRSISVDLIYGLPQQTRASFARTVLRIIACAPDRISVFNYAHLPERFKVQRQIDASTLPSVADKLAILQHTGEALLAAGYCYIGMDHFARPRDELATAQRERKLQRNFQGYSTRGDCHLIGLGVTAIGALGDCYYQNARELASYNQMIDSGVLAVERGLELDEDDRLRRHVIGELICHFELDIPAIERRFEIVFADYFAAELESLLPFEDDGLLVLGVERIEVLPRGRLLIRNICMEFDWYLPQVDGSRFSRVL